MHKDKELTIDEIIAMPLKPVSRTEEIGYQCSRFYKCKYCNHAYSHCTCNE